MTPTLRIAKLERCIRSQKRILYNLKSYLPKPPIPTDRPTYKVEEKVGLEKKFREKFYSLHFKN